MFNNALVFKYTSIPLADPGGTNTSTDKTFNDFL